MYKTVESKQPTKTQALYPAKTSFPVTVNHGFSPVLWGVLNLSCIKDTTQLQWGLVL